MARHRIKTEPDVVPEHTFFVRLYVEGDHSTRLTLNRGASAPGVDLNYRTAVKDAERETRRDGKTRWVSVEQVLKETRISPLVSAPAPEGTDALLGGIEEVAAYLPDPDDETVDYTALVKDIYRKLGSDKLDELIRLLQDASDPDMRSPK